MSGQTELEESYEQLQEQVRRLRAELAQLRRETSAQYRNAEQRLSALFNVPLLGVMYWNTSGAIIDANNAFLEMVGYERADLAAGNLSWRKLTPPEFVEMDNQALDELTRQGICTPYEKQYIRKDGSRIWIYIGAKLLDDTQGICYTLDITRRREIEASLRHAEAERRVALESARLGTWILDPADMSVRWDKRCRELFGATEDEPVSISLAVGRIHPDDRDAVEIAIASALSPESDGEYDMQYRVIRPDGSQRWVQAVGRTKFEGDGPNRKAVVFSGVIMDRTETINATEAVRHAKEEAERANKAKDDFLATLSHELRTPLTPILLTAQTWETDLAIPSEMREDWQMVRRNIELESRLIDDLLDLTRIARGKVRIDLAPVALGAILEQAIGICRADAQAKQITIDARSVLQSNLRVMGDGSRLTQVFCNLLKNAIKFTGSGGEVHISIKQPAADRVAVVVRDNGIGIEPALLPHIFNAFEQGGSETSKRFGGLGLGLAICRSLIEMHRGEIQAASDGRNRGATFTVTLPTAT